MKNKLLFITLTLFVLLITIPNYALAESDIILPNAEAWYYLRCMNNYLNITADGKAELRNLSQNEAFYVESLGYDRYTLKMKDGRYLGIEGDRKNGSRLVAMNSPYTWLIYGQAPGNRTKDTDIFALRSPEANQLIVNASGQKNADGTPIILWESKFWLTLNQHQQAPNHARFRFIPVTTEDPTGESWHTFTENGLTGYKDMSGKVVIPAKFYRASNFSDGIARVQNEQIYYAYINTKGELITQYKYFSGEKTVENGLISVLKLVTTTSKGYSGDLRKDFYYLSGFIDKTGKEVIPVEYDSARSFSEGLAAVFKFQRMIDGQEEYKAGWIDTTGKLVIPYMSGGTTNYSWDVFDFKDGLSCYFVDTDNNPDTLPAAGIIDKTGKIIIPANPDRWFPSGNFGLQWADGVISMTYATETNEQGVPTKGGNRNWEFTELYDYSGKLIKKLDGYVYAYHLGGGFIIAQHMLPNGSEVYWSVFDRNGNMIIAREQEGNMYGMINYPMGYDNGYVYFHGDKFKVTPPAVTTIKP